MARDVYPDDYNQGYLKQPALMSYEDLVENQKELDTWQYDLEVKERELVKFEAQLQTKQDYLVDAKKNLDKLSGYLDERRAGLDDDNANLRTVVLAVQAANREPLEILNDALLQLELDVDPIEIAKNIRELVKTLDIKW